MGALVELYVLMVVLSASYSLESRNASRTMSAQPVATMKGAAPTMAATPVIPAPRAIACDLLFMICGLLRNCLVLGVVLGLIHLAG